MTKKDKIEKKILGKLKAIQGEKGKSVFVSNLGERKRHTTKYEKHLVKQHGRKKAIEIMIRKEYQNRSAKAA